MEKFNTIVIGAGQAGLSASHELTQRSVDHVVLERDRIGSGWANRWSSFCLVTPNWSVQLPGFPYDRDDPDGFMPRDEIVAYLERYAASFECPVRTGIEVREIKSCSFGGFEVKTNDETIFAKNLIVSTGAYQKPHFPKGAEAFPESIQKFDTTRFKSESELPLGDVLIIGSGQTGCQLAEELHAAGRKVVLSCGRAPWAPRRIGGKDLMWWLNESGFLDVDATTLPAPARLFANVLASGHHGGHDLHYRTLVDQGVSLAGRFLDVENGQVRFAADLSQSVGWGDDRYRQLRDHFQAFAKKRGLPTPQLDEPDAFVHQGVENLDLATFGSVIFTGGFRPDYSTWLPWADAFDEGGFPIQKDGSSTVVPGLHFVGLHFMRTRKSALLCGVGEDATVVATSIAPL